MNILSDLLPELLKRTGAVFTLGVILGTGAGIGYMKAVDAYGTQTKCGQIECSQIDQAKYYRLKPGMTVAEVEAILGPGTEQSQTATETIVVWQNSEDYTITAAFVDGKLKERRQL